ncbi:MAG TPA: NADH-quinone oxidoreductase subunit L [Terriglobales bacterium]|nr:NADH-quinone oxidoreductase subunit L [Terriglobales bacterium]
MTPNFHLWLIPLLPLVGAAINGLFGRRFGRKLAASVGLTFSGAACAQGLWVALEFSSLGTGLYRESLAVWIHAGDLHVDFAFYLDQLSLIMLLIVSGVGFLIHIYSVGYMGKEAGLYRFFSYLNLFLFFMLTLVLASNYLLMFVGWEGVGLASYLLIGFWFTKDQAASAGKKAFIANRIGDFGFLIGLFLLIKHFGSLDFESLFASIQLRSPETQGAGLLTSIALLLMVGACGKSAQIPLYVWLPDAMEGPTPVSALIHAATMVTAGIYMIARSHLIFDRAPVAGMTVAILGTLTAFFAATIAIVQTDIKKVLAYSTISQLGYMFLACGVAAYTAGIFHLMTHAFFKGLLFLAAGAVMHATGGEQDMRAMGGLRTKIPWTFWTMTMATFAIAGIPPLAGFFSKDEILWQAYASARGSWLYWLLGVITASMTSFYMFRLWFLTFFGEYRGGRAQAHLPAQPAGPGGQAGSHNLPRVSSEHGGIHESPKVMLVPMVILAVLSVVGGWVSYHHTFENFLSPVFRGAGAASAVETRPSSSAGESPLEESGERETLFTTLSVAAAAFGFFLAWLLYHRRPELPKSIAHEILGLYHTVLHKYYVDELYAILFVNPLLKGSAKLLWRGIDQNVIDAGLDASAHATRRLSDTMRHMQSGNLRSYAGWMSLGAAAVIAYMVWTGIP